MHLGSAATPTDSPTWEAAYNEQVAQKHVKGCYFYGQSTPTYSQVDQIPGSHAIAYQHKGSTRTSFDQTLGTFPATRPAYIFLHPINEIDRQVHTGVLTLAQAQQRCDDLYAAITVSGKQVDGSGGYVVPSIGIQYWCLLNYLRGNLGSRKEWDFPAYIRPGLQRILFSVYASGHVKNGHAVATSDEDPYTMAHNIDAELDKYHGVGWIAVLGFPIPTTYINDLTSLENRVTWLEESFDAYRSMEHPPSHMLWFDKYWSALGDERLSETKLLAKWLELTKLVGQ